MPSPAPARHRAIEVAHAELLESLRALAGAEQAAAAGGTDRALTSEIVRLRAEVNARREALLDLLRA